MKNGQLITISQLTDFSRLPEIFSLAYKTFLENNLILPSESEQMDLYPQLNKSGHTIIIIAECEGRIIATNSVTMDGENGLHTDTHFKKETDEWRRKSKALGSLWRIATEKKYRNNVKLIKDILKKTVEVIEVMGIATVVFTIEKRHEKIYKRIFGAETIAEKVSSLDRNPKHEISMVLMVSNIEKMKNSLKLAGFYSN